MSQTKIDQMIAEATAELEKRQQAFNHNNQLMQQAKQMNAQLSSEMDQISGSINAMNQLKGLGNAAFQSVDDATATPEEAAAPKEEEKDVAESA